jgi:hypothetical protein
MAASFDDSASSGSLACVVLLSSGGQTRARLEAVLRRPGLRAIFCDDALEALAEVTRAAAGKGPASCVLLLDQPRTLPGLGECFEAIAKFVEPPIVWVFEPGPPVSLKDTPWEQASQLAQQIDRERALGEASLRGLGNPLGNPAGEPVSTMLPATMPVSKGKPSANEWVASATESWAMPGLPAGAKASTRSAPPALRLTGEPLAPSAVQPPMQPKPAAQQNTGGFDGPDALAEATPQPKTSWLGSGAGSAGQVLSDDELAMLLGPDGQPGAGGFAAPKD